MDCRWKEEPSSVLMKSIWSLSFMEEPTSTTWKSRGEEKGWLRSGVTRLKGHVWQRMHRSVSSLRRTQRCSWCQYSCILAFMFALRKLINIPACTAARTHLLKAALRSVRTFSIKFLCRLEETLYWLSIQSFIAHKVKTLRTGHAKSCQPTNHHNVQDTHKQGNQWGGIDWN